VKQRAERMTRYLQAVGWLQAVPLRPSRPPELLSALMIRRALAQNPAASRELDRFIGSMERLMGERGHACLVDVPVDDRIDANVLHEAKENLSVAWQDRLTGKRREDEVAVFLLPRWELVDSIVLGQSRGIRRNRLPAITRTWPEPWPPSGLDVAAWLGSAFARRALGDQPQVLEQIDAMLRQGWPRRPAGPAISDVRVDPVRQSLYESWLACLVALVDPPEPDAPAFVKSSAWEAKCCQTLLAGWALARHALALWAEEPVIAVCGPPEPAGFVEPEPEFFGRMAVFSRQAAGVFDDVLDEDEAYSRHWYFVPELCHRLERVAHRQLRGVELSAADRTAIRSYGSRIAKFMGYCGNTMKDARDAAPVVATVAAAVDPRKPPSTFHVAVGRPRALYVLYPWKGKKVLCRGSVLPYYEFTSPTRLTDDDWKKRLDAKPGPRPPAWAEPLLSDEPGRPEKP
jgi:uncharacterized protein DUF3160